MIHKRSSDYEQFKNHQNGIHEFLDQILLSHEKEFHKKSTEVSDEKCKTFLSQIYSIRGTMTYEEIKESTFTFLSAGFDTTGKIIAATLLLLAMNPKVQEKLLMELESVLISGNDEINEENLNEMVFLEQVIKEAARLIPPVLILAREVTKNIGLGEIFKF